VRRSPARPPRKEHWPRSVEAAMPSTWPSVAVAVIGQPRPIQTTSAHPELRGGFSRRTGLALRRPALRSEQHMLVVRASLSSMSNEPPRARSAFEGDVAVLLARTPPAASSPVPADELLAQALNGSGPRLGGQPPSRAKLARVAHPESSSVDRPGRRPASMARASARGTVGTTMVTARSGDGLATRVVAPCRL